MSGCLRASGPMGRVHVVGGQITTSWKEEQQFTGFSGRPQLAKRQQSAVCL